MIECCRRLAVFVDEVEPGRFYWVIIENHSDATGWIDLDRSAEAFSTWGEAFDVACAEMYKLVPDERIGPRRAD